MRGQTYSELDTSIEEPYITERVQLQLSMTAYNALNQMYLGPEWLRSIPRPLLKTYSTAPGACLPGRDSSREIAL